MIGQKPMVAITRCMMNMTMVQTLITASETLLSRETLCFMKAIDRNFLWVFRRIKFPWDVKRTLEKLVNHLPTGSWFASFFSFSPKIPRRVYYCIKTRKNTFLKNVEFLPLVGYNKSRRTRHLMLKSLRLLHNYVSKVLGRIKFKIWLNLNRFF